MSPAAAVRHLDVAVDQCLGGFQKAKRRTGIS